MTQPDSLLAGLDLEREYRTGPEMVRVLRGASVEIRAGEVVALVGASGVGKSTLLHLLGALDRPTAGRVLFQGEDLFSRSEPSLARYRRQQSLRRTRLQDRLHPLRFDDLTAKEKIFHGMKRQWDRARYLIEQSRRQDQNADPLAAQLFGEVGRR